MNKKIILFICKHNRFRSKVAEAFFNKLNENKDYISKSAGLIPGKSPLDKTQVEVAKEFGLNLKGKPKPVTTDLLSKMHLMIIVADNVPSELFSNKKYGREEIIWKIEDDYEGTVENNRRIIEKIKDKVEDFVRSLNG